MRFGLFLPNFGEGFCDAGALAALAREAEAAGWDGFFLWDHVAPGPWPAVDPWVALTAVALATERLRLGPLVTPLARRRPWTLARETVSLDRLSGGRLVFGAGLGSGRASEWEDLGEERDPRRRAELTDERLELLVRLWRGEAFAFEGRHHRVRALAFTPTPLQAPRIPVWIAAYWPHRRPLRRAARWDGVFPLFRGVEPPADLPLLARTVEAVASARAPDAGPFDVAYCARPRSHDGPDTQPDRVAPYAEAGATWWLDRLTPDEFGSDWHGPWPGDAIREHVRRGPPRRPR